MALSRVESRYRGRRGCTGITSGLSDSEGVSLVRLIDTVILLGLGSIPDSRDWRGHKRGWWDCNGSCRDSTERGHRRDPVPRSRSLWSPYLSGTKDWGTNSGCCRDSDD